MPKNFWKIVNEVIARSDILLIVLDARLIDETRNPELEEKIEKADKEIIHVINKADLADKGFLERIKNEFENCVFMSAKMHQGTNLLRKEIMRLSKGKKALVGVLGYPNTGKSSVINALSGAGSAKVAPVSGYTKALQLLKASEKIYMLDTPGVIPFMEKDEVKHLLIGSMNPCKAKDPDLAAEIIIKNNRKAVSDAYSIIISDQEDSYEVLERIAEKMNYLKKGAEKDIKRASIKVLEDWQKGRILHKNI
jgi:ribosome biogenesis GTPase A